MWAPHREAVDTRRSRGTGPVSDLGRLRLEQNELPLRKLVEELRDLFRKGRRGLLQLIPERDQQRPEALGLFQDLPDQRTDVVRAVIRARSDVQEDGPTLFAEAS